MGIGKEVREDGLWGRPQWTFYVQFESTSELVDLATLLFQRLVQANWILQFPDMHAHKGVAGKPARPCWKKFSMGHFI